MQASTLDMSATPPLSCQGILGCVTTTCPSANDLMTCLGGCVNMGSATGKQQFGAVENCIIMYCQIDAGRATFLSCATAALKSTTMCASFVAPTMCMM
jgi:hypothetical protein